jgi:predicted metal-binding membrane protein
MAMWWCMPGMGLPNLRSVSATERVGSSVPILLLMCAAMTLPGALPAAQHVATNTFRRRRSATVGVFMAVYLLVWLAAIAGLEFLLIRSGGAPREAMFSVVLVCAALYELTPMKHRALNRCHRGWPLAPTGSRSVKATARFAHAAEGSGSHWATWG